MPTAIKRFWLTRKDGTKFSWAGRTEEQARMNAASFVYDGLRGDSMTVVDDDDTPQFTIRSSDVFKLNPDPITKKAFKQRVKSGEIFMVIGNNNTGETFVSGISQLGGSWVARVAIERGFVTRVIR